MYQKIKGKVKKRKKETRNIVDHLDNKYIKSAKVCTANQQKSAHIHEINFPSKGNMFVYYGNQLIQKAPNRKKKSTVQSLCF